MEKNKLPWFRLKDLGEDITLISDNGLANMYLVEGRDKALLIDTGWGIGKLREVVASLTSLPIIVINTHCHLDHISGNSDFEEFYISKKDSEMLKVCFDKEFRRGIADGILNGPYTREMDRESWINKPFTRALFIEGEPVFDLGGREIEVVEVPGHTKGSLCLLDRNTGTLFGGDSISTVQLWLHLEESTTLKEYLESMERLLGYSDRIKRIHAGHTSNMEPLIIEHITESLDSIINGAARGVPYHTFAGDGLLAKFKKCSILYDDKKIV